MKNKLIQQSKNELTIFINVYEALSGNKVDLTYLQNSNVRAFYNKKDEIIGGYVLSTYEKNGFLRYFNFLGEKQGSVLASNNMNLPEFVEITCIFFTKFTSTYQRIQIISFSLFDALMFDKKYILGGGFVSSFNNRMKSVLQKTLFDGEIQLYGDIKVFTLLYEERKNIISNWFIAFIKESSNLIIKSLKRALRV